MYLYKIIPLFLSLMLSITGAYAQVTEAKIYTIGSDAEMFGMALEAGTIIYDRQDKSSYLLTDAVQATQTLFSTADKIRLNGTGDPDHGQLPENVAVISHYGGIADGVTDISRVLEKAMADADVILFPATNEGGNYLVSAHVRIPLNKIFRIEKGALIHVTGKLIGEGTRIEAGPYMVFSPESNLTGTWSTDAAYPEWFGAMAGSNQDSRDAIQKTLDVFRKNVWLTGDSYRVNGSLMIRSGNTLFMNMSTALVPDAFSNADLFQITGEPFILAGGRVKVERGYHAWIFNVAIDRQGENDNSPRLTSLIRDITVEGFVYGENDFSGMAYNGIKLRSAKKGDYSYFSTMDNVNFYRPDTAIYLTGNDESGMNNSWHWSNITIDWTMRGIILEPRAAGHVFTNLIIQPNTRVKSTIIEVASKYNSFQGIIWDIHNPNTIVLRKGAEHNYFSHMGRVDIYEKFVRDETVHKAINVFSTSNPFEPTANHYGVYTDEIVGIGIRDNRYSNLPKLTVRNDNSFAGGFIRTTTITGSDDFNSSQGTMPGLVISTRTTSDMVDGFGGGLVFNIKDRDTDTTEYGLNLAARIMARRDGADDRGMLQLFSRGKNASQPTLTLRNNGYVGIGTSTPRSLLEIKGTLRATGTVTLEEVLQLEPHDTPPPNFNAGK
ncbi:MAG: hypothetical protein P8100_08240 [bacterium]